MMDRRLNKLEVIYRRTQSGRLDDEQQLCRWLQWSLDVPQSYGIRTPADWRRVADGIIGRARATRIDLVLASVVDDVNDPQRPDGWAVRTFVASAETVRAVRIRGADAVLDELSTLAAAWRQKQEDRGWIDAKGALV